ncbi:MAG: hypothetical protein WAN36_03905, partial [Calditrichia bacterium]
MKRIRLFEFEDARWFPGFLRNLVTDYLRFTVSFFGLYRPVLPLLAESLKKTGEARLLDLCSGGGGPLLQLIPELRRMSGLLVSAELTDKFPSRHLSHFAGSVKQESILIRKEPLDALQIPAELPGFRTFFNSFHHFSIEEGRQILRQAEAARAGIGIFELTGRDFLTMLLVFFSPLLVIVITPLIRPFSWKRLLFTYLLPMVPFVIWWDGIISN